MATTATHELPESLRHLSSDAHSKRIELSALTFEDTEAILKYVLGGQVNSSTVVMLQELSGGNALHLRELTLDAQTARALTLKGRYWTLDQRWTPQGSRISDLISSRLKEQPEEVRESIELLSVTGRLPYPLAQRLFGESLPTLLDSRLAKLIVLSVDEATGERDLAVDLSAGLAPQSVLSTLSPSKLRGYLLRADNAFPREVLTSRARARFTTHRVQLGIEVPASELFEDVVGSADARRFAQVVALTDSVRHDAFTDKRMLEKLLVLRADALYELAKSEAALAVLKPLLLTGSAEVRGVAARIAFSGLARPDLALEIIDAGPQDPVESRAFGLILRARAQQIVDLAKLREYASDERISPELRTACLAHAIIEDCYAGKPVDALEEFLDLVSGDFWRTATPAVQSEIVFALPTLMSALGGGGEALTSILAGIDFTSLALNPSNYLTGMGIELLEQGLAVKALDSFEQALALISVSDPYLVSGFTSSFAAAAAVMIGDRPRARFHYNVARSAPHVAGQIMRPLAQRYLLPVILELEGRQAALEHLHQCIVHADKFGRKLLRMRLLHDAWRLELTDGETELNVAAEQVQGPLAKALSGYAEVLDSLSEDAIVRLCDTHASADRPLYAAEFAHRASSRARSLGRRALSTRMLGLSVDLAAPLTEVNTPSLGRGRIVRSLLTEREYVICVLAARARSNQEIAEELFLSPRTVEGHLQRSYTKLGITDRRQLLPVSDSVAISDEILDEKFKTIPVSGPKTT
ncbi:LuxR C-terminal-related transcriptional regulator [Glutamicibacter arilaitensis]|uniref:helix-turn-helix transcriptional regulator n=1 Tax=Glutamicibacter arilaitensis TaxID=256701 RepID=UPI00384C5BC4